MKNAYPPTVRQQQGVTLVELMVSLTIGLVIILVTAATYLGSQESSRLSDAQARMNEDGQAALSILTQQLRMVGANPAQPDRSEACRRDPVYDETVLFPILPIPSPSPPVCAVVGTQAYVIRGCDGTFSNIGSATTVSGLTCVSGTTDSLAITYQADIYNTIPTDDDKATDCLGYRLPEQGYILDDGALVPIVDPSTQVADVTVYVADNRYYIATPSDSTVPSLYCKGNGNGTTQPLVENVEDMQITYGVASGQPIDPKLFVAGYMNAATLLTQTDLAAFPSDAARWARVVAVRLCVQVRSETNVLSSASSTQYRACDGTLITNAPDRRLRRTYETTVVLRNRLDI